MNCFPPGLTDFNGLKIFNSNKPVPLKAIDIDVGIKGFVANVTAVLVYKNPEENTIEVIYKFPVDDSSAVYRFEAEVEGGRVIVAECQEKQQAKKTYDEAMESGHTAAFMEEADSISDIFSMKVGNIPPGGLVRITFGYVTELKLLAESGVTRFTLYTLLNPRYNPDPASGGLSNPPTVAYIKEGKQPYYFNFKAKVGNSTPITNIVSAKDELKVEYNSDKTEASVSLAKPFIADHDLSLDISFSDPFKPHVIIEKGVAKEEGVLKEDLVMLNFFPELKDSDYTTNHEFIIVIDRSGSMQGSRIKSAQETLLLFLKSLPMGCYFNIIGFGSHFNKLFPEGSKELSEESMKAAMDYQKALDAGFGGTEILQPLQDVYSKPAMTTHSRQLFILTDGEVFNTNEVISAVRKNAINTRVFTFGIGEGASTALVKGIARAGRGRAEFIKEGERMQPIVMKTLKAAMQHGITDLKLDWNLGGSPKLVQVPKELPPLFSGDRLIVYAVSSGQAVLDGKVHLKGKIGQRELDFGLDVHSGQVKSSEDGTLPLHRLAAKSQIQQLQDEEKENSEENKAAVILLSTASNIISHHTAMVAVDRQKSAKLTGKRTVHEVPHLLGPSLQFFSRSRCAEAMARSRCAEPMARSRCAEPMARSRCAEPMARSRCAEPMMVQCGGPVSLESLEEIYARKRSASGSRTRSRGGAMAFKRYSAAMPAGGAMMCDSMAMQMDSQGAPAAVVEVVTGYMAVVQLQSFSGSWKLDAELEKAVEVDLNKMKSSKPENISDEVWATLLALAVLNMKYSDNKDEWEMIEMKAQQWLNTQQLHNHSLSSLLDLAKAAVKN